MRPRAQDLVSPAGLTRQTALLRRRARARVWAEKAVETVIWALGLSVLALLGLTALISLR